MYITLLSMYYTYALHKIIHLHLLRIINIICIYATSVNLGLSLILCSSKLYQSKRDMSNGWHVCSRCVCQYSNVVLKYIIYCIQ